MILDAIYALLLLIVKTGLKFKYDVTHEGLDNIPKKGPAIFISNHTSIVDTFLIGAYLPRKVFFMAKSTEFESLAKRIFFNISRSFPVRRYDIDPISLRNAFKILDFGGMVGIYPEGERTWDGEMLPLRRGTVRFMLAAGVPIIPTCISGAYFHQPRWGGKVGEPKITVKVGKPISAPKIAGRLQTEKDIDSLYKTVLSRISALAEKV